MRIVSSLGTIVVILTVLGISKPSFARPQQPTATFTVTTANDVVDLNPGDGRCDAVVDTLFPGDQCSLRAAIQEANAQAGGDLILVPSGAYTLTRNGNNEDDGALGDLDITDDLTMIGASDYSTIIQGEANWNDRIVHVHQNAIVSLVQLTIQDGHPQDPEKFTEGGGIHNAGELTVIKSTITNNSAAFGNGIYSTGVLTVSATTIRANESNNSIYGAGGGIYMDTGKLILMNSVVNHNYATTKGGGIALACVKSATITNTTISDNSAEFSGGLEGNCLVSTITLNNVTIVNNIADANNDGSGHGGGITGQNSSKISIANTIVAGNHRGNGTADDCNGFILSQGYNLIQALTGCSLNGMGIGNILGMQPQLGPLQANGGSTWSHMPLPGSPVLNAGNSAAPNSGSGTCAATDQRNVSRPVNGRCDIGAIEGAADILVFLPFVVKP